MWRHGWLLLVLPIGSVVTSDEPTQDVGRTDEAILNRFLGSAGTETLLRFLRSQVLDETTQKNVQQLIETLGSETFRERQAAQRRLLEMGPVAIPFLQKATSHPDAEIAGRARRCLQELQQGPRVELPLAAIRTLIRRKEPTILPLTLELFRSLPEEISRSSIIDQLADLSRQDPQARQSMREALGSPQSRALAIAVLLKISDAAEVADLDRFLNDPDPEVRFPLALHRLEHHDRGAIPILISVIRDTSSPMVWQQAEEALYAAAGDNAPVVVVKSGTGEGRRAIAEQWEAWWRSKASNEPLGQPTDNMIDLCVVAETGVRNRVFEWRLNGA